MENYTEEDSGSSTPSFRFRWDVFLSFRGEDTRHTFTDHLYKELVKNGVRTFRDDEELPRGEEIAPTLLDAIHDSAVAIAVISRRYADSRWCLEELATIVECNRLLLPVFYQVNPLDVRRQKGPFENDFKKLEERFSADKVDRWRKALEKAGDKSGWDSNVWEEEALIQSLVKTILTKMSNAPLGVAKYPVGLNSRLEELMGMLDVKANGLRIVGIHGMGGAGKTTLAKALYDKLVPQFKRRSFISSVREVVSGQTDGLLVLRNKLIANLSQSSGPELIISRSLKKLKEFLQEEPVLIVLDDIDDAIQLDELLGKRQWYFEGSRIIITTRHREALGGTFVDRDYQMKELSPNEALELLTYHAFGRATPLRESTRLREFADVSEQVVSLIGGLPLALEVFGSCLFDKRSKKDWNDAVIKLKQVCPCELQDVLQISFNGLDDHEKCAFLDIACLLVQAKMKREDAVYVFKGCGLTGEILINSLVTKSLIKFVEDDILWMHDQLKDMGRQIVIHEAQDIGMPNRLWENDQVLDVLRNEKGTRSIQGIALDAGKDRHELSTRALYWGYFCMEPNFKSAFRYLKEMFKSFFGGSESGQNVTLHTKSFSPMINLRLLRIDDVELHGSFKFIPAALRYLQWRGCPLKILLSGFCLENVAVLDLVESNIKKLWEDSWWSLHQKRAEKLLVMNLRGCVHLTELPNLSAHTALEKLILERCMALVKIHRSVGDLKKLCYLNLKDCSELVEFPSDVSGLKQLEVLILSGCRKLRELPNMRSLKCLRQLFIDDMPIVSLPNSIYHLMKLEIFSLKNCSQLKQLPECIKKLTSLKELSLDGSALEVIPNSIAALTNLETLSLVGCKSLTAVPDAIGNLRSLIELFLGQTSITELPSSVGSLSHLRILSVSHCRHLSKLPDTIGGLASLNQLWLNGTSLVELPDQVGALIMLEKLYMQDCTALKILPDAIGKMLSITFLILNRSAITELPESIGQLDRLQKLSLNKCERFQRLPSSIGSLKSLHYLLMEDTPISGLPDSFGMLSNLTELEMGKNPHIQQTSSSIHTGLVNHLLFPKSISTLSSLRALNARACMFYGEVPDEFEKLTLLETLNLSHNSFSGLPSSLRGLSILKDLILANCKQLKSIPPLPSSLLKLNAENCTALESIHDISNLESLRDLNLTNCNKISDIEGLQHLKSLRRLYLSGCNTGLHAVKERLSKVALKHLFNLSIPGSMIPDWFSQEIPRISIPKNQEIKGVIIAVVVSLDQQVSDPYRDLLPSIVDIQAKVFRVDDAIGQPVYTTTLNLYGVPSTNEHQLFLCRYHDFEVFTLMLKHGDRIQIARSETPCFRGLSLEKFGIHLVFENDDDINDDDDEVMLDESQRSVSWKIAKFLGSL